MIISQWLILDDFLLPVFQCVVGIDFLPSFVSRVVPFDRLSGDRSIILSDVRVKRIIVVAIDGEKVVSANTRTVVS